MLKKILQAKPYIIAEIGANHNGDINKAFYLIKNAKKAGCDAVKFQSWNEKSLISKTGYKQNKVFILGGVNPQIFKINPTKRETLADILFTKDGPLADSTAKRSEVYLLRGKNPVIAYHLDAQSPTRIIVADALELRPNDILYVAEQPIISFNRTLATVIPLRLLLRDIQDGELP